MRWNYNVLYNIVASKLAEELPITNRAYIIIDKSKNNEKFRQEFNRLFLPSLNNPKNHSITLEHKDSVNLKGLQMADVISWSVYQCIEHENNEYVGLIENITVKRVFED